MRPGGIIGNQGPAGTGGGNGPYVHGSKTTTQMLAIAGPATGDTCYNTDWEKPAWYDGQVWLCDGAVRMTNKAGAALSIKDTVVLNTFNDRAVGTTTITANDDVQGIIIIGGDADAEVVVAVSGIWPTVADGSIFKGDWIRTTTTAGRVSGSSSSIVGSFGKALNSVSAGQDVLVAFSVVEGA